MTFILSFFILEDATGFYNLSRSLIIVLAVSTAASTAMFAGLSMYRKSLVGTGLAVSALLGFFAGIPLSGLLGPMGALHVGAAAGFGTYLLGRRLSRARLRLLAVLAGVLAIIAITTMALTRP